MTTNSSDTEAIERPRRRWWASLWLVALVSLAVLVPRTLLIAYEHNEATDDEYHLQRGIAFFEGFRPRWTWNDPPVGEAILSFPAWLTAGDISGWQYGNEWQAVYYNHRLGPDRLRMLLAGWKALLTIPLPLIAFAWCRRIYGPRAAWLAVALILTEPTFAAHTAYLGLDIPGVTTILLACWTAWLYLSDPRPMRLIVAAVATALAMVTKHTAVILPGVLLLYALIAPSPSGAPGESAGQSMSRSLRLRLNRGAALILLVLPFIWAWLGFDISAPRLAGRQFPASYTEHWSFTTDVVNPISDMNLPAGIYIGSLMEAYLHGQEGHPTFLFGEVRDHAPWYHQLVVAAYKVPIGTAIVMLLALGSLIWLRPTRHEAPIAIAAAAWGVFILTSGIGIGFRHFLPVYVFILMLSGRILSDHAAAIAAGQTSAVNSRRARSAITAIAWTAVAATAIHGIIWHPDYLSYINFPRDRVHLHISDSNVDWGQGFKQVDRWLAEHPQQRMVYLGPFNRNADLAMAHHIRHPVTFQGPGPLPESGLLIISKIHVAQVYTRWGTGELARLPHIADIGHSMLVYDLDALRAAGHTP